MDISARLKRPVDWFVLTGKRRFVTLVLFTAVVCTLVGLGVVASVEMRHCSASRTRYRRCSTRC